MQYTIKTGTRASDLAAVLSGRMLSRSPLTTLPAGLNTKTLIFTTPSVTVTFSTPTDLADVVSQINTQVQAVDPGFVAKLISASVSLAATSGGIAQLIQFLPGREAGIVLSDTGTANSSLGFSVTSGDSSLSAYRVGESSIVTFGEQYGGGSFALVDGRGAVGFDFTAAGSNETTSLSHVGSCELVEAIVINNEGSGVYFQLHDTSSALTGTEVPYVTIPVQSGEKFSLDPKEPFLFGAGLAWAISSTEATYTAASTGGKVYLTYRF